MNHQQPDFFSHLDDTFVISTADVLKHQSRMIKQIENKSGAIKRLSRARYDDVISKKVAEENLRLREEVSLLKRLVAKSA